MPNKTNKKDPLKRKAYKKYIDISFAKYLINGNPDSELIKSYIRSAYCQDVIRPNEELEIESSYCKNLWCNTCQKIKTAKLMNQYLEQLETYKDKYFVTLTTKTCSENELGQRLTDMAKVWLGIRTKSKSSYGIKIHGLKKIEINPTHDKKYHPHFHILVTSKQQAEFIINEWLQRWKKLYPTKRLTNLKAQDLRKMENEGLPEVFKYTTKNVTRNNLVEQKDKLGRAVLATAKHNTIYTHLKGIRTFQTFGEIKKDNTEYQPKDPIKYPSKLEGKPAKWQIHDWHTSEGKKLTNYKPSKEVKKFIEQMTKNE